MPPRSRSDRDLRLVHPHQWIWEPLLDDPRFLLRSMFGAKAAYLDGKLMLCFCARAEPWRGVLVCTEREQHAALVAEFSSLRPHAVLPKWLYLPESDSGFETTAEKLVRLSRRRDPRLGVVPQPKRTKSTRTL